MAVDAVLVKRGSQPGSIADEFKREGVFFRKAHKADRKSGWEKILRMLQNAGKPDKPADITHVISRNLILI